ncbi:MAG TPA: O-antigen ligase family protein [Candidatus Sulfotelmatobacter sp.]|nr:O-antigen ligase family protein [Candidatus Sulfotelmatobacter sp.]
MDTVTHFGPKGAVLSDKKEPAPEHKASFVQKEPLRGAFFWLGAFFVVYCARPEDWIPGLSYIPLAKLTGVFALVGLVMSIGRAKRHFRDVPLEGRLLLALVCLLVPASLLSPVWRGGAFMHSLDFAKVVIGWVLTFLVVTNLPRLQQIIFIQTASVAVVAIVSIAKGHSAPRLQGVLGGIYSNPNDLAFAIVLSLPFALMFLLQGQGLLRKLAWVLALLVMAGALVLTGSRAGFIQLVIAGSVCLWHFGVKGRRPMLLVTTFLVGAALLIGAGGKIKSRFMAISGDIDSGLDQAAYGSYEERRALLISSFEAMLHYPILGIGVNNFTTYSGRWKEVHNSYLQIGVEGGVFALTLYLLFFWCGFRSLKRLRKRRDLEPGMVLLVGALHSSLIGFVVGAMFAPEAYQFFPYFAVAYVSTLAQMVRERDAEVALDRPVVGRRRDLEIYAHYRRADSATFIR